jgi:hypothetical protein
MYLRPNEIGIKLGVSRKHSSWIIGQSKPREKKRSDGKTLFNFSDVLKWIKNARRY